MSLYGIHSVIFNIDLFTTFNSSILDIYSNGAVICILQNNFSIQSSLTVDHFQVHYESLARELFQQDVT